jgi:hypothetical protein
MKARLNRCAKCGRFVGESFTGYSHDRLSKRGALFCDRCVAIAEKQRPIPQSSERLPL